MGMTKPSTYDIGLVSKSNGSSSAGDRADHQQWFRAGSDFMGKWKVGRIVREILLASVETDHGAALAGDMITNRAAEHRVAGFDRVEDGTNRRFSIYIDLQFARRDAGERSQVI